MTTLRKYPRTPHLPWSEGGTSDDAYLFDTRHFEGREVVVTEKLDGENTTLYRDHTHARSLDSRGHPSRDWVKALHGTVRHDIPEGWRVCGENVFARHSIAYDDLLSYFYVFSVWDAEGCALPWAETVDWCRLLGLETTPVLRQPDVWDEGAIREIEIDRNRQEGYVVRVSEGFDHSNFGTSIAKWVRRGHVQTDQHWMHQTIVPNGLRDGR